MAQSKPTSAQSSPCSCTMLNMPPIPESAATAIPATPAAVPNAPAAQTPDAAPPKRGPDRRQKNERRSGDERRQRTRDEAGYSGPERRSGADRRSPVDRRTGLERRRGPGVRRSDDRKAAEEGEMTVEQFEFVMAIQMYKRVNKKMYPTWTEVLEVVRQLGYRKVLPREIRLDNVPEPRFFAPDEKAA